MTDFDIIKQYVELNAQKKQIEAELDTLKTHLVNILNAHGTDSLYIAPYSVSNKIIVSHRFDSKAFQKDHLTMYNKYVKESSSPRFTVTL